MDHVLAILAILAIWALLVFVSPTKACRSCAGSRGPCSRCKGTGRRFRLGAKQLHKVKLSLQQAWDER